MPNETPRYIFISHACGDPDWPHLEVEQLARSLQALGFEVDLDLWVEQPLRNLGSDTEWQDWMCLCLRRAAHVIVLDATCYTERAQAKPPYGKVAVGRGVALEFLDLRDWLYSQKQHNQGRVLRYIKGEQATLPGLDGKVPVFHAPSDEARLLGSLQATCDTGPNLVPSHAYLRHHLEELREKHERAVTRNATKRRIPMERKGTRLANTAILKACVSAGAPPEETPFADASEAFRQQFNNRKKPQLVVLGEPGAGKSFALENCFCELAQVALADAQAPVPLLIRLGDWTKANEALHTFIARQLAPDLHTQWTQLKASGHAVLLLDAFNEIPTGQRDAKAIELRKLADQPHWAGVLVSCRELDFTGPLQLPFDQLVLQPLHPVQILDFLKKWEAQEFDEPQATARAEAKFWQIAAGPAQASAAHAVWRKWAAAGASLAQFWTKADKPPEANPDVYSNTSTADDDLWRAMLGERSLMRLASSPYWLELMAELEVIPDNQALLTTDFLNATYTAEVEREKKLGNTAPNQAVWLNVLQDLAEKLQGGANDEAASAQTRLPLRDAPRDLTDALIAFSVSANILKRSDDQIYFSHQLLQEALSARVILSAFDAGESAHRFWPALQWWARSGWEVVAELAGQSLWGPGAAQSTKLCAFVAWLAQAQPDLAATVWRKAGSPPLPAPALQAIAKDWCPLLTNITRLPNPLARAAVGRALAAFDLDHRPGIGVRPDGVPDMEWVEFNDQQPFVYQGQPHPGLPPFALARYPVTHAQFQAFVDAPDGYGEARWWKGLAKRHEAPKDAAWPDANAPRERVSWFEAVAFCRWLSHRTGETVHLPTEQQWERGAAGREGWAYPSAKEDYQVGHANCDESQLTGGVYVGRTCAVGLYPQGVTPEGGLHDMAGNVWEWCLNDYRNPENVAFGGDVARVLRGGSWDSVPRNLRSAFRVSGAPVFRNYDFGFRLARTEF